MAMMHGRAHRPKRGVCLDPNRARHAIILEDQALGDAGRSDPIWGSLACEVQYYAAVVRIG